MTIAIALAINQMARFHKNRIASRLRVDGANYTCIQAGMFSVLKLAKFAPYFAGNTKFRNSIFAGCVQVF